MPEEGPCIVSEEFLCALTIGKAIPGLTTLSKASRNLPETRRSYEQTSTIGHYLTFRHHASYI